MATTKKRPQESSKLVALNTRIPKRLNIWVNIKCAERDVSKQDFITHLINRYKSEDDDFNQDLERSERDAKGGLANAS